MKKQQLISNPALLRCYESMLLIRKFEERAAQLYGMKLIGGFCHLYIGQEAIAVGIRESYKEGDSVITSYRDHGAMLVAGSDPKSVMSELLGRRDGCSKGKGGSMHIFDVDRGFFGGHGIVGAQVSLGTGLAFAHNYNNNDNVSFAFFGDGAVNQGQVYESFNMAKLWNLPIIYIIENNRYSMGTALSRACSTTELYKRGASFDIPGYPVDGMDIFDVIQHGKMATEHCRSAKGPIILEMNTYRYRGHSMSDPAQYRKKEEVEEMKNNHDPINNLASYLLSNQICSEDELETIAQKLKTIVEEAINYSKASPFPDEEELYTNIYSS